MFCTKCGSQIPEGNRFCNVCGQPVPGAAPAPASAPAPTPTPAPKSAPAPAPKPAPAPAPKKAKKSGGGRKAALIVVVVLLVVALLAAVALAGYMIWDSLNGDKEESSRKEEASESAVAEETPSAEDSEEESESEESEPAQRERDRALQVAKDANTRAVRGAAAIKILTEEIVSGTAGWRATATVDEDGEITDLTVDPVDTVVTDTQPTGDVDGTYTVFIEPIDDLAPTTDTHRYELIVADMSWIDANNYCMAQGGHLATVTTAEEESEIIALAEAQGVSYIWLGGQTDVDSSGNVSAWWVTGENFYSGYQNWMAGEPSGVDMGESGNNVPESYLMLWNVKDGWNWNDQRNDPWTVAKSMAGKMGFVCEFE